MDFLWALRGLGQLLPGSKVLLSRVESEIGEAGVETLTTMSSYKVHYPIDTHEARLKLLRR